jgi:hypothetical protein
MHPLFYCAAAWLAAVGMILLFFKSAIPNENEHEETEFINLN